VIVPVGRVDRRRDANSGKTEFGRLAGRGPTNKDFPMNSQQDNKSTTDPLDSFWKRQANSAELDGCIVRPAERGGDYAAAAETLNVRASLSWMEASMPPLTSPTGIKRRSLAA